jgi:2-polyprenyl-3-methyl-5-hydroxy-6-metoxy-1,4-benzoquinol methylase
MKDLSGLGDLTGLKTCRYCAQFHTHDPAYPRRRAAHDLSTSFPRCHWHWRYLCSVCGKPMHFSGLTWCAATGQFTCLHCAPAPIHSENANVSGPAYRRVDVPFWGWEYYWEITCPHCGDAHPALDRLEFLGQHPWQVIPGAARRHLGLSPESAFQPMYVSQHVPLDGAVDDAAIAAQWNVIAANWDARYSDEGDSSRENLLNAVLWRLLGDVQGQRVLDAGCGAGYFCRLLAKRGAIVTGVDLSSSFLEMARQRAPELAITYHQGSVSHMPFLAEASFDAAVSVCVLQDVRDYLGMIREVHRVLRPGGVLALATMHPCFSTPPGNGWERQPADTVRPEDRLYWRVGDYFQLTREIWHWTSVGTATGFHRPLSAIMTELLSAGFRLRDFVEPYPSPEVVAARPAERLPDTRIPLFLVLGLVKD